MNKADVIRMADECQLFDGIWSHPELKELKADKFIKFAIKTLHSKGIG